MCARRRWHNLERRCVRRMGVLDWDWELAHTGPGAARSVTRRRASRKAFSLCQVRVSTRWDPAAAVQVLKFFSYEHFYVIYCKFWELDQDHDFLLDKNDLAHYSNCALSYVIVDRIFEEVGGTGAWGGPRGRHTGLAGIVRHHWAGVVKKWVANAVRLRKCNKR